VAIAGGTAEAPLTGWSAGVVAAAFVPAAPGAIAPIDPGSIAGPVVVVPLGQPTATVTVAVRDIAHRVPRPFPGTLAGGGGSTAPIAVLALALLVDPPPPSRLVIAEPRPDFVACPVHHATIAAVPLRIAAVAPIVAAVAFVPSFGHVCSSSKPVICRVCDSSAVQQ